MISVEEEKEILDLAYVPEHVPELMIRVSKGEPFLVEDYFCCRTRDLLIVVGYPLKHEFTANGLESILRKMVKMFHPSYVSIAAPELPPSICGSCRERESDHYYTLDLTALHVRPGLKRIVNKAGQCASVERGYNLSSVHYGLAQEFVQRVSPPPRIRELLFRMWDYVGFVETAVVLNAWGPNKKLAAFYVVDLAAGDFSTYVIGCHSKENYVLGASDLLFHEMVRLSREHGKRYIHLGLGVNDGIRRFKEKWGGVPSRPYEMCEIAVRKPSILDAIMDQLKR